MKKYLWWLFAIFIFITPTSNIIVFILNNDFIQANEISEILYPRRTWPEKNKNQLTIWQFLYEDSINKVVNANNKIVNGFNEFYISEFYKYLATESKNAGKPGYDEIGIPIKDIDDYLTNKIILSYNMQIYMALTLRTYFIEFNINKINDPSSSFINPNEYLNLWVMKYFQAGFFFQWVKIWIQDLGRTVEKSINIDFYTFGPLVKTDSKGDEIWSEGPISKAKVNPLLALDLVMSNMINELYDKILTNK